MKKTLLSIFLIFTLLIVSLPSFAEESDNVTVFISISHYGEFVIDKNGKTVTYSPVTLTGKDTYTLDDVFRQAHNLYYPEGDEGYSSSIGDWGFGVDMLWGDTSYNFGYQLNGGVQSVTGLDQTVAEGDFVDAYIFNYSDQSYAKFNHQFISTSVDKPVSIELYNACGYDENWNNLFSPCDNAIITIDGNETEFITDENGFAEISFAEEGTYVISAKKTKVSDDKIVSVITSPACIVTVEVPQSVQLIHNIAEYYSNCDFESAGGNLPWIIADMAVYESIYPDSDYIFSDKRKTEALNILVSFAENATTPGDLAKSILAIRSLGYNTENIYTPNFNNISIAERLLTLVDSNDESVTNIYTLPYVIKALSQSIEYGTNEQITKLIDSALYSCALWQDVSYGTDALTPMIFALAPYYGSNENVKIVLDTSIEILKSKQRADGLIDGFEGYESASTGLSICALSSLGINSDDIKNGEFSLIDGLLSVANDELNGFSNEFAREQGFRGLLSWRMCMDTPEKVMYDFSNYPLNNINIPNINNCPVKFDVSPATATVVIENTNEISTNLFDLDEGTYSYTVSATGYISENGTFIVSADEAQNRTLKTITLSLSEKQSSGGGSSGGGGGGGNRTNDSSDNENESKTDTDDTENSIQDNEPENSLTAYLAFSDIDKDAWYYPAVQYVYENNLISGTDIGFEPDSFMTRAMLVTILHRLAAPDTEYESNPFTDVSEEKWYFNSVNWAVNNGITAGISDNLFAPDESITREQIATIIYRFAKHCGYNTNVEEIHTLENFIDNEQISNFAIEAVRYMTYTGIMNGREENYFASKETATRAELSAVIMRFMEACK